MRAIKLLKLASLKFSSFFFEHKIILSGDYKIVVPKRHPLRAILFKHKNYDRFLPLLTRVLGDDDIIVDVGANIGDTLIRICSENSKPKIICFEPIQRYYDYLSKNIKLNPQIDEKRISLHKIALSDKKEMISMQVISGTASRIDSGNDKIEAVTLDDMLSTSKISIIKIDTDGFDWKVLKGANEIILSQNPILFFEVQIANRTVLDQYFIEIRKMLEAGYRIFVFDNYGNFIFTVSDDILLRECLSFPLNSTRESKVYYYDILAVHKACKHLYEAENLIASYANR